MHQFEDEHAFLCTQAGGMEDLGTIPGWPNSFATAISDSGEVVGSDGLNSDVTRFPLDTFGRDAASAGIE